MNKENISGIYAITNKTSGKKYIGSSKSVHYRWNQSHRPNLRNNIHGNRHLQSSWNKYGEDQFKFEVIEKCNQSVLLEREGYWIEHYNSWDREFGYNFTRIIDGKQVLCEESRRKIRETKNLKLELENYWTTGTNGEVLKLFKEGTSKNAIAKKLGITRSNVYSCLEQNGLHEKTGKGSEVKLTYEVRNKVTELRDQGMTWKKVIENVPVSETQLFRANAIVPDGKYIHPRRETYRTVTPEKIKELNNLINQGKTWTEIEVELGITRTAFWEHGIKPTAKSNKGYTWLSPDKREEIIRLKKEGNTWKEVCVMANVSYTTIRNYKIHEEINPKRTTKRKKKATITEPLKMDDKKREEIIRLKKEGKTWPEVCKIASTSYSTIKNYKIHEDVREFKKNKKMTESKKEEILALKKEGRTWKEISSITGISCRTIRDHKLNL